MKVHFYTKCMGREEVFHVDLEHLDHEMGGFWQKGPVIAQPMYHPFRALAYSVAFGYIAAVPVLYLAIYRFRKRQDRDVTGTEHCKTFYISLSLTQNSVI